MAAEDRAAPGTEEPARRDPWFDWHPDPGLLAMDDDASLPALQALGADVWATAMAYLHEQARARPVAADTYPEMRARFFAPSGGEPAPAPEDAEPWSDVLGEIRERLLPFQFNSQHRRAWSYFTPPPLPTAVAADVLVQWFNQGVDIWAASPSAAFVEEEVTGWLRSLVGAGEGSWAVLTSGGMMANFMALAVARDQRLRSLLGAAAPPRGRALERVRAYASDQTHFSVARSLNLLGFPHETLRVLPSDDRFRLRGDALARAVRQDLRDGWLPWCVSAVGGSTNTGSVDAIGELEPICREHGMWLHADAAYGGAARLSEREAGRVPDLELADSVTIDPHKWFFQPYDVGALVVRSHDELLATFHDAPEYYRHTRPQDHPLHWYRYSFEGTRRFRALKLWVSWKHLGTRGFGRLVERNLEVAAHLAARIRESDDFEALPPEPELSVVCFRHLPGGTAAARGRDPEDLDRHQDLLQRAFERSGEGWVSTTRLRGRTYLRAGIVNYLSDTSDADRVLEALRRLARDLPETGGEPAPRAASS